MKRNRWNAQNVVIISRPDLRLDWCSNAAAKYAVKHWHYSKSLPTPPLVKIGVWESGRFIGCILFSRGSNNNSLKPFNLDVTAGCELTRIALDVHQSPVTRIASIGIKLMRQSNPGLRLILSYADPNKGHNGAIYQAGGWIYSGQTSPDIEYIDPNGRHWHSRQVSRTGVSRQYGEYRPVPKFSDCQPIRLDGKHRYLYPLDKAMEAQIAPLAQPYPKRPKDSSEPPATHAGEGGAAPTRTLQNLFPVRDRMAQLVGK